MQTEEIWKDISGFEGRYMVSNLGRVKSVWKLKTKVGEPDRYRDSVMKLSTTKRGYTRISLKKEGLKNYPVHRLVALAFIPNPHNLPFINHKDENPSNNCVDNLEWCTPKYNAIYGTAKRRCSRAYDIKNNKSGVVYAYTLNGEFVARFESVWDAGEDSNTNASLYDLYQCGELEIISSIHANPDLLNGK